VHADVVVEVDLAPGYVAHPTSLAPDVWWDATPRLTVGLVHSHASLDQLVPGATFCVTKRDPDACNHVYNGSGLDVRYAVLPWLEPRARFVVHDIDPVKPSLLAGAFVHGEWGRWGLAADPYLEGGLANMTEGNRSAIWVPVRASAAIAAAHVWLDTGWNAELRTWSDDWHVPVGVGASVGGQLAVGAELGFRTLLGPQNTPKERVLFVFVSWGSS
jgi:hypothetical protein